MTQVPSRRVFLERTGCALAASVLASKGAARAAAAARPNILFAIADDQSWPFTSAYGCKFVDTPAFDRVAREGILFNYGYTAAPQCSPTRAALLTGRYTWQIEEAGVHASNFPKKFKVYPELLEAAGYHVGYTGKGWGPGNWEISGRKQNPAGKQYGGNTIEPPASGISSNDYAANFEDFLAARPAGTPFCFWYGATEPHLGFEKGSGLRLGKSPDDVTVPPFLPNVQTVREDLLDYAVEIEWFDAHLGRMLDALERIGELDRTLIVVTSDNGMPFPRAKANCYEYGVHMPMAMRWGDVSDGGRVVDDFVSFVDLAPTFLDAAGLTPPAEMTGRSLLPVLRAKGSGLIDKTRDRVQFGRERHTHARPNNFAYPIRALRTHDFLYIWNVKAERWPAGDPPGYYDIDGSPTRDLVVDGGGKYKEWAVGMRPEEELYAVRADEGCLVNLAGDPNYGDVLRAMREELQAKLREQRDPRVLGYGDIFESYPRYSSMRNFDGFKAQGEYNPVFQVKTP